MTMSAGPIHSTILSVLRLLNGHYIDAGELTRRVYGSDDKPQRTALRMAIYHMRRRCPDMVIETRYGNVKHGRGGYRPVRLP